MKTKKMRKGAIAALGAIFAISAGFAGATLAGGNSAFAMNTSSATTVLSGDLWDSTANGVNKTSLLALTSKITGAGTSYEDLTAALGSATNNKISSADLRTKNGNKDIVVTFGGQVWTVTYVSEDITGNVIATLWLADGGHTDLQPFSAGWTHSSTTYDASIDYPANMYSTSYIRSYLNGTPYVQASGATPGTSELAVSSNSVLSINKTGAQGATWKTFLSDKKASYLVSPQYVSWQTSGLEDDPVVGGYSSLTVPNNQLYAKQLNPDYSQKGSDNTAYTAWGRDLLWLPSVVETGVTTGGEIAGLWGISKNQRMNDTGVVNSSVDGNSMRYNYSLTRTAGQHSKGVTLLSATGDGIRNDMGLARCSAVRPAIHFNLTKAYSKVQTEAKDIYNEATGAFNRTNLNGFYKQLGATDYASLSNSLAGGTVFTSAQLAELNNRQGDVSVNFAGYKWTVTYLSTTTSGDVIATLWYDDEEDNSVFSNNWCSGAQTGGYEGYTKHSNHYGGSYLRSIALGNGGQYWSATGTSVSSDVDVTLKTATAAEAQTSKFYNLAQGTASQYLATPSQVGWQQDEYNPNLSAGYRLQNENLVEVTDNWYSENIKNSQNDPLYYGWANDKIWLPSLTETGTNSTLGIWNTSLNQRKSKFSGGSGSSSWLRSSIRACAYGASILNENGEDYNANSTNNTFGVRPAIHLNLTEAEKNVKDSYFNEVNKDLQDRWNAAVEESLFNGGKQVTFTLDKNWYALPDAANQTSFGTGAGFSGGRLFVPVGANIVLDLNGYRLDRNLSDLVTNGNTICNSGTLTVMDGKGKNLGLITGAMNLSDNGGGIITSGGARTTIDGGTISGNRTRYGGAGIMSHAPLIINGGIIENNHAPQSATGGVINSVYFEMNGGIIRNNSSDSSGGGLYFAFDGEFYINGGEIYGNTVTGDGLIGSGIYIRAGKLTINDVKIHDNAASSGAGIAIASYNNKSPEVIINGGEIYENTAKRAGGGIYITNSTLTLNGGRIYGNLVKNTDTSVQTTGGGVFITGDRSTFVMNGGMIDHNYAERYAGGVYLNAGTFTMNGGTFASNSSVRGGGTYLNGGTFNFNNGLFTENSAGSATDSGAAIYVTSRTQFYMHGGTVAGNKANGDGAIYVNATNSFYLYGGTVINNNTATKVAPNVALYCSTTITSKIVIAGNLSKMPTRIGVGRINVPLGEFTQSYVSSGNTAGDFSKYFHADIAGYTITASGNELQLVSGTQSSKTTVTWRYTHEGATTTIADSYQAVEYTGKPYTVSLASGTIGKCIDESGRPVTAMINAGKYYLAVSNPQSVLNSALTFEILPADLSAATVTVAGGSVYNGKEQTPEVKVELNGVILEKDKDYTLEYSRNINSGTAKVSVVGAGNYGGNILKNFEIEKRNLEIRWNNLTAEYDGKTKGALAFAEGLLDGETVSITLAYSQDGVKVTPLNAGSYTVYAILGVSANYKLAENAQASEAFVISPKTVEAVWGNSKFVYNGKAQAPKATYVSIDGKTFALTVTVNGAHANADEYTAIASVDNGNYKVSAASANLRYTIAKKAVTPTVGADTNPYDGKGFVPEITVNNLSGNKLTLTYEYLEDGVSLGAVAPVNVGKYVARVTLADPNYAIDGGYYDFAYSITPSTAAGSWTFTDKTFDGSGKAPVFAYTDSTETLGFTVTYGQDKGDGTADEYTADKPVFAGDYVAKIEFANGNYNEILHTFTVEKKQVSVSWSGDNLSVIGSGNSYKWLFDGKEHAPVATASVSGVTVDGTAITELKVVVAGQINAGSYTATAALDSDEEINANFTLAGNSQAYTIAQSTVMAVKWYEYGSKTPVTDGAKLSYQYISVYGWNGPNLSAYGVAAMQGQGPDGSTVTVTVEVPLTVSYTGSTNASGYWAIGNYGAVAAIRNQDKSGNCVTSLTSTDLSIGFEVTEKQLETVEATIIWVYDADATEDVASGVYYWTYDGKAHAPEARRVLPGSTYDPTDNTTYEVLPVGGARTDAGSYYAYILPSCGYDIAEADADCLFEIRPREITVAWTGVGGAGNVFDWVYDGLPHAPVARVTGGAGGLTVAIEAIAEYTDVGSYLAVAKVNGNFIIKEDATSSATCSFSVKQLTLDPDDIVWKGKDGSTTDFTWIHDGKAHAPSATLEITLNGNPVTISLKVTGEASTVGAHTAYAMLDSSVAANANFVLKGASCDFNIENGAVAKIEWEGAENGGKIEFVYDGKTHTPKAYYWLDGDKHYLNVVGGASDAGEYVAHVTDETGVTAGMSCVFTIKPAELNVVWSQTKAEYDKAAHSPVASFEDGDGNAVALTLGKDYAVSSFTTVGTYTAEITFLNKNYTYSGTTGSVEFTVTPKKIFISWTANNDGSFNFEYNGTAQKPAFTYTESGVKVVVTGEETAVGTYVAVAVVDDINYTVYDAAHTDKAEREFSIIPFAITVDWKGENGSATDFEWEYDDGVYVAPAATYTDWGGNEQPLTVRGERTDAGKYTATAVLPVNCSFKFTSGENAGTHAFEITPKLITGIVWEGKDGSATDFEWEYDGSVITPVAKTADGDILAVAGGATDAGEYTAFAVLPNTQNYKFDENVGGKHKFKITEMTVDVIWEGKDGSATDFVWDYTGLIICPTAKFKDVSGSFVRVPVNGGASAAGQHTATAADVFANYVFSEISQTQVFTVREKVLTVTWSDSDKIVDGVYTYVYNGKAQMPLASSAEKVNISYSVTNEAGEIVSSVIGAGKYTVMISPADKNYIIDSSAARVDVEITKKTVEVKWQSNLSLLYTGSEVAPEAWFVDADNQAVALKVTGGKTEAGTGYTATADFVAPNDNYVLKEDTAEISFDIVKNTDDKVWDWETGAWKTPETPEPPATEGGDGENGETEEPEVIE